MKEGRYIRQTLLNAIGEEGQNKLLKAHICVVGCGGLGSIAAPYLAGAGIGKLTLIDADRPHVTNLHRQVFFTEKDQDSKSAMLAKHISELNPTIEVELASNVQLQDCERSLFR